MTTEDLIRAYYAAFNRRDVEGFLALLAEEVMHDVNQGGRQVGKGAFRRFLDRMNERYEERIVDLVVTTGVDGAHAAAEFTVLGRYLKTDDGLPPARGQRYRLAAGAFFEVRDGKVARITNTYNVRNWISQVCEPASVVAGIRVERLTRDGFAKSLPGLARLRMTVFRDFPYLYEGDEAYETRYVETYAKSPDSVIVAAFDGDNLIGAATGAPLEHEHEYIKAPFHAAGFDASKIFYFGESVLLPTYRNRGIGVAFFEHREAHARVLQRFDRVVFCAVTRSADHPKRPSDYAPLDGFWRNRGYRPLAGIESVFSWRDIGDNVPTEKPMRFWIREI
ncbi:MAG TPA: ketosteroid isomerase-related protein [Alphaproteobacteria bacterium]|nr:ketosteroid isomerase-related protein [Alphaproteobacteria bacterium]